MERPRFSDRFWQKVSLSKGCWEWNAAKNKGGYGITFRSGKTMLAHRASWEMHSGKIPEGLRVLHKCDNPGCVNPSHLFLGTDLDNVLDKMAKGRYVHADRRAEKSPTRKLNWLKVNAIRARFNAGETAIDLASEFSISVRNIYMVVRGQSWIQE